MFLRRLRSVPMAEHDEALYLVEQHELVGRGIGWIDAHLLASARLARVGLWTLDRPLWKIAASLKVAV